jgi:hypothetical protein
VENSREEYMLCDVQNTNRPILCSVSET